jgi:hypothetical protein
MRGVPAVHDGAESPPPAPRATRDGALGRVRRRLAVLAVLAASGSCARESAAPPERGELETVDVAPALDAAASIAGDVVERRPVAPEGGVAGVLPEGFPRDVPLPTPSSLVDFGPGPRGGTSVTLEVAVPPAAALAACEARLRAAGFVAAGDGVWTRGSRRVAVGVEPFAGVARLTLEAF